MGMDAGWRKAKSMQIIQSLCALLKSDISEIKKGYVREALHASLKLYMDAMKEDDNSLVFSDARIIEVGDALIKRPEDVGELLGGLTEKAG